MNQLIRTFATADGNFVDRFSKPKAMKGKNRATNGSIVLEALASR